MSGHSSEPPKGSLAWHLWLQEPAGDKSNESNDEKNMKFWKDFFGEEYKINN